MQPGMNVSSSNENSPARKYKVNNYTDDRFTASQERYQASQDRYVSETEYNSKKSASYYGRDNIAAQSMKVAGNKNLLVRDKQDSDNEIFMKLQERNKEKRSKIKQDLVNMRVNK